MIISDLFSCITTVYQGDDLTFSVMVPNYDSAVNTLAYTYAKKGVMPFTIQSTPGLGSKFDFSVASSTTSEWVPGSYLVSCYTLDGVGKKVTLGQAEATIKPDVSLVENGDPRHPYRIAFDDCEAALASGAGSDLAEYTIGGTVIKKNRAGLLALRAYYLGRVRQVTGVAAIGTIRYYL